MKPTVIVILPTYNGMKFIQEQIHSIATQRDVVVELWVRDDGSNDGTEEFIRQCPLIHNVVEDSKGRLGTTGSLLEMINRIPNADFLAFADQDDVWEPNHLVNAIAYLRIQESTLYFPRYRVFHHNQIVQPRELKKARLLSVQNSFVENPIIGTGIVINKASISTIKKIKFSTATHFDWQMYFLHAYMGVIYQGDTIGVNYRIHEKNQVGFGGRFNYINIFRTEETLIRLRNAKRDFDSIREQINSIRQIQNVEQNETLYSTEKSDKFIFRLLNFRRVQFERSTKFHQIIFVVLYIFYGF